ncbi:MAG: hypothetical protein ABI183_11470 [Polyangiaceae bacterium]
MGCARSPSSGGCSNDDSASTFNEPDAGLEDTSCQGSLDNCPCGTIADYCASSGCIATLAEADDASTWGSVPNCTTEKSTNVCSNAVELVEHGIDTGATHYYDKTSGALIGAASVINLKWSCWGTIPTGCGDTWTLAPAFGTFDAGVCYPLDAEPPDAGDVGDASDGADD